MDQTVDSFELQSFSSLCSSQDDASSNHFAPSSKLEQSYISPIVIISNPWRTWVAFGSSSLLCLALSLVVIIQFSYLWYLSLTLAIFSVVLILQAKRERYEFDINIGKCTMKSWSVIGRGSREYWFHEIKELSLEESTDTQGGTEVDLYLVLRSGLRINMLCSHLCGLEAEVKRELFTTITEYLQGSKIHNAPEWVDKATMLQSHSAERKHD